MNWMELRFPRHLIPWSVFESYIDEPRFIPVLDMDHYCPRVDIYEGERKYRVRVELPGISDKEFKLETRNRHMILSGEWPEVKEDEEKALCRELTSGRFSRSFHLPENVDTEKIEAVFKHGILEITLPLKEDEKPKAVSVNVN